MTKPSFWFLLTILCGIGGCTTNSKQEHARSEGHSRQAVLDVQGSGLSAPMLDILDEARFLHEQGSADYQEGNYKRAETRLLASQTSRDSILPADHPSQVATLNNLALVSIAQGEYAAAERYYRDILRIQKISTRFPSHDLAVTLGNYASLLLKLGRYREAEGNYRQALMVREALFGDESTEVALGLNQLGELLQVTGRYEEAEQSYRRALSIWALAPEDEEVTACLNNLATLLRTLGRHHEAEPLLRRALEDTQQRYGDNHSEVALALNNLAALSYSVGRVEQAEILYQDAFRVAMATGAPEARWIVQGNLRTLYGEQEDIDRAILFGKLALNEIQYVRRNLRSLSKQIQRAFVSTKESYYRELAHLLIVSGRLNEAEHVLDLLKISEYLDFVGAHADYQERLNFGVPCVGLERQWCDRYQVIVALASSEFAQYNDDVDPGITELLEGLQTASLSLDSREAGHVWEDAGSNQPHPVQSRKHSLETGEASLKYVVSENFVDIIVTASGIRTARTVKIKLDHLRALVARFRDELDHQMDISEIAGVLYHHLIDPVSDILEEHESHTLRLSLDDALRYLPMAALATEQGYLIEQYTLANDSWANIEKNLQRPSIKQHVSALGTSHSVAVEDVYAPDGMRVFSPLAMVEDELNLIVKEGPDDPYGFFPGTIRLDHNFGRQAFIDALANPIVHIASHFSLQPGNYTRSFLILGTGERLTLDNVDRGEYDLSQVNLLALSACSTAVGGLDLLHPGNQGGEVDSFAALAKEAGVDSVIATLWSVEDEGSGVVMYHFYDLYHSQALSLPEALRRAQLQILRGDAGGSTLTTRPHPYYWAPYVLI